MQKHGVCSAAPNLSPWPYAASTVQLPGTWIRAIWCRLVSNRSDWAPFLQVCVFWVTGFVTELQYNFILSLPITIQLLFALQLSTGRLLWWQHAGWHVLQHLWLREWCLLSPAHNFFWRNLQDPCYFWTPFSKIWLKMGNKLKHKDDKMGSPWDHMKLPPPGNMSKTYLKLGDGVWCVRKRSSFTWQSQSMGRAIRPPPQPQNPFPPPVKSSFLCLWWACTEG